MYKKQLRAQRWAAKRQGGPILLIKNNVFSFWRYKSYDKHGKKTIKENPVTYLQIALADKKSFWYFPA
ncbi:hypothetical protein UA44_02345 [Klebsiella aerogenes]|nr:hypothetical protein UA44_02345 [Klebsiella aerogenes]